MVAEIMEKDKNKKIKIGDVVKVKLAGGRIAEFKIVVSSESNPLEGKISDVSPLGKSLLGSEKGNKVKYSVNGKEFEVEIV